MSSNITIGDYVFIFHKDCYKVGQVINISFTFFEFPSTEMLEIYIEREDRFVIYPKKSLIKCPNILAQLFK